MTETPTRPIPPAALSATERLGCSLAFVRLHWGAHRCLDGQVFEGLCLITDPSREERAVELMAARPATPTNPTDPRSER